MNVYKPNKNHIMSAIFGLAVADALGVPVEFRTRASLAHNPVTDMVGGGTHSYPAGTWSDDTSMTLCLADSLAQGLDLDDIISRFQSWLYKAEYTSHGKTFGIGRCTLRAIHKYSKGIAATECGGRSELDNGNGSLMRILPLAFYLKSNYNLDTQAAECFAIVHQVSSLTHAHPRSLIACGIYISIAMLLLEGYDLTSAIKLGINKSVDFYSQQTAYNSELTHFNRITSPDFVQLDITQIKSSGYVVDTLEAALWCLLNTTSYSDCVLRAVNLGEDTDTVAAVAGGIAGIYYGYEQIPSSWLSQLTRYDFIADICSRLQNKLAGTD